MIPDPDGALPWRYDPVLGGPSLVLGDIGTHAHNLVRFVTCRDVDEVAADIGHIVANRLIDDYAGALLRFDNGAHGSFWVTQAATGVENCLSIRVSGTCGTVEWMQELPTQSDLPARRIPRGNPHTQRPRHAATRGSGQPDRRRPPRGLPRGIRQRVFRRGRGNRSATLGLRSRSAGAALPRTALDGLKGVEFVDAAVRSSVANGAWTTV